MRCWTSKKRKIFAPTSSNASRRSLFSYRSKRDRDKRMEGILLSLDRRFASIANIRLCSITRARAFGEKGWTSVTSVMTSWQERERGSWFQLSLPPFLLFFQVCQPCYFDRGEFLRRLNFREDSFSFFFFFSLKVKFPIVARIYVYTHTRSTKLYVARYLSRRGPMPPQSRKEWF